MQLFESLSKCFGTDAATRLNGGCGWKEIGPIINELLSNIIMVGVFIGVSMIAYAGFVLVTERGNQNSVSRVKKIFKNIVIGMFLLVGSYYIVEFVLDTLNVKAEYRKDSLPKR